MFAKILAERGNFRSYSAAFEKLAETHQDPLVQEIWLESEGAV